MSAVIPIRNKATFLQRCVGSILDAAAISGVEVLLVENRSTDGSNVEVDSLFGQRATVIHSAARTVAMARNEGARAAQGEILCFLDADVVVPPDFFHRVERVFRSEAVVAAGCTVALPEDHWISAAWGRLHDRGIANLTGLINSADFCIRREPFWQVGGFDATLVTGEDADLCLRLEERGHVLVELPYLQVVHLDNPTTLRSFARKELWHGLGATATFRVDRLDRPFLLTILHVALVLAAIALILLNRSSLGAWALGLAAVLAVPLLSVVYRRALARQPAPLLASLVLYQVYFLARAAALGMAALGKSRS